MTVITAQRSALAAVLRHGTIVVEKGNIPILNNVRIAVSRGQASLTFTDLSLWFSTSIAADADAITVATLPAALLKGAVDSMEGAQLKIETTDGRAVVSCGRSRLRMPTELADGFPVLTETFDGLSATVKADDLAGALTAAGYAAPTDHSKYPAGVLFDFTAGDLNIASYDGVRLAHDLMLSDGSDLDPFTLPLKATRLLAKLCAEAGKADVEITATDRLARFQCGDWSLCSKLIDATPAPYAQVISDRPGDPVWFDPREMERALGRLSLVADQFTQGVKLTLSGDKIAMDLVNAKSVTDASEEISAAYEGEPQEVGYNLGYLRAALRNLPGDDAEMFIGSPVRRALIASRDGVGGTHLIGPYAI